MSLAILASMLVSVLPIVTYAQYGGGGGPPVGLLGITFGGHVLGAATTTVPQTTAASCTVLLTSYLRVGRSNNSAQVKLLQTFLNSQSFTVPVTGYFGALTKAAVEKFQTAHAADILTPSGLTAPNGNVYKATESEINKIYCASIGQPLPSIN